MNELTSEDSMAWFMHLCLHMKINRQELTDLISLSNESNLSVEQVQKQVVQMGFEKPTVSEVQQAMNEVYEQASSQEDLGRKGTQALGKELQHTKLTCSTAVNSSNSLFNMMANQKLANNNKAAHKCNHHCHTQKKPRTKSKMPKISASKNPYDVNLKLPSSPTVEQMMLQPNRPSVNLVTNILQSMPSIPMVFDTECTGFGHPSTAVILMKNLRNMGFQGEFEILFTPENKVKLEKLMKGFSGDSQKVQDIPGIGTVKANAIKAVDLQNGTVAKSLKKRPIAFGSPCMPKNSDTYNPLSADNQDMHGFRTKAYNVGATIGLHPPGFKDQAQIELQTNFNHKKGLMNPRNKAVNKTVLTRPGGLHVADQTRPSKQLPKSMTPPSTRLAGAKTPAQVAGSLITLQQENKLKYQPTYGLKPNGTTKPDEALEMLSLAWDQVAEKGSNTTPTVIAPVGGVDAEALQKLQERIDNNQVPSRYPIHICKSAQEAHEKLAQADGYCTIILGIEKLKKHEFDELFVQGTVPVVRDSATTNDEMVERGIPYVCAGGRNGKSADKFTDNFHQIWYPGHESRVSPNVPGRETFIRGSEALAYSHVKHPKMKHQAVADLADMLTQCQNGGLDGFFQSAREQYMGQPDKLAASIRMLYDHDPNLFPSVKVPEDYKPGKRTTKRNAPTDFTLTPKAQVNKKPTKKIPQASFARNILGTGITLLDRGQQVYPRFSSAVLQNKVVTAQMLEGFTTEIKAKMNNQHYQIQSPLLQQLFADSRQDPRAVAQQISFHLDYQIAALEPDGLERQLFVDSENFHRPKLKRESRDQFSGFIENPRSGNTHAAQLTHFLMTEFNDFIKGHGLSMN